MGLFDELQIKKSGYKSNCESNVATHRRLKKFELKFGNSTMSPSTSLSENGGIFETREKDPIVIKFRVLVEDITTRNQNQNKYLENFKKKKEAKRQKKFN